MDSASDKPSTACFHCRRQKIRCSRDLPLCTRCSRHNLNCNYPDPPDRRQIANSRRTHLASDDVSKVTLGAQKPGRHPSSLGACTRLGDDHLSSELEKHPAQDPSTASSYRSSFSNEGSNAIPPPEIGVALLETYFSRIFNASLLFHQPSFTNDYKRGNVKEHVYLSIFAIASLFFRNHPVPSVTKDPGLSNPAIYHSGRHWAERASAGALQHADRGGLDIIQACENLALYWWAVGEPQRAYFHSVASYTACQMLGLEQMSLKPALWSELTFEMTRRCFWACWIKQCVHDAPSMGSNRLQYVSKLPLPCDDAQYDNLDPSKELTFSTLQTLSDFPFQVDASRGQSSSLVRIFTIWMEIKSTVYSKSPIDTYNYVGRIFELDRRVRQLNVLLSAPEGRGADPWHEFDLSNPKSMLSFTAYHQCLLLLHIAISPAFSTSKSNEERSPLVAEVASRALLTSATAITRMIAVFLARHSDITKVPSFVGYCAFTCGVVHLVLYRMTSHESFSGHLQVSLLLLRELAAYWPVMSAKYEHLQAITMPQIPTPTSLPQFDGETHGAEIEEMCTIGSRALSQPAAAGIVPSVLRSLPIEAAYTASPGDIKSAMLPRRFTDHTEAIHLAQPSSSTPVSLNREISSHLPVANNASEYGKSGFIDRSLVEPSLDQGIFDLLFGQHGDFSEPFF